MTPSEFKAQRLALGLSASQMASVLAATTRSVRRWEAGEQPVPGFATAITDLLDMLPATKRDRWIRERIGGEPYHL